MTPSEFKNTCVKYFKQNMNHYEWYEKNCIYNHRKSYGIRFYYHKHNKENWLFNECMFVIKYVFATKSWELWHNGNFFYEGKTINECCDKLFKEELL